MILLPQNLVPISEGCFVLLFACYFPLVLGLSLSTGAHVFYFFPALFFQSSVKCLPHPLLGGVTTVCFFYFFSLQGVS